MPLLALCALLAFPGPALAQEEGEGEEGAAADTMPDPAIAKADSIRASLVRPPPKPPSGVPVWLRTPAAVVTAPFRLLLKGAVEAGEAVTSAIPPGRVVGFLEELDEWGLDVDVGDIGPRSGEALELRLERYPPFVVEAGNSLRGSRRLALGIELGGAAEVDEEEENIELAATDHAFWARGTYAYEYHDEPHFWGVGPDTPDIQESDFLWERHLVTADGRFLLTPSLRVGGVVGFEDNRTAGDGRDDGKPPVGLTFDPDRLFGLADQTQLVRAGASVTLDRTRWEGIQRRGFLAAFGLTGFEGVGGTDTDFHRFEAEAHAYLPITPRHGLAFRALGEMNRGESRHEIPFFHLAPLGSTRGLRGFPSWRFRDRDMAALMSEYRYEIWQDEPAGAEGFLFFDIGGVARSLDELDTLKTSWGLGVRFIKEEDLMGLVYLAFSEEETRVALKLDWPF